MTKLWLVKRIKNDVGCDEYDSFLIAEDSATEAIRYHPNGWKLLPSNNSFHLDARDFSKTWPVTATIIDLSARCIGEAYSNIAAGTILLTSFNAG